MTELRAMGLSWGEVQSAAKYTTLGWDIVVALRPTGEVEDK